MAAENDGPIRRFRGDLLRGSEEHQRDPFLFLIQFQKGSPDHRTLQ